VQDKVKKAIRHSPHSDVTSGSLSPAVAAIKSIPLPRWLRERRLLLFRRV
jgi:hypothetical protein